jgi:hypothetical protein
MDRWETVIFLMTQPTGESEREVIQEARYSVNVLTLVLSFVRAGYHTFEKVDFGTKLIKLLQSEMPELYQLPKDIQIKASQEPEVSDELILFGLIQREPFMTSEPYWNQTGPRSIQTSYREQTAYQLEFTIKMHRFRYWLTVNKLMPDERGLRPNKP